MKKLILCLAMVAFVGSAFAQRHEGGTYYGVSLGYSTKNIKFNSDNYSLSLKPDASTPAYQAAFLFGKDFMPYLGAEINVGLEYATSNYNSLFNKKHTMTMLSIDAAPRLKVQFPLTNDLRIFAYAGPTLSYNLIYNDKADGQDAEDMDGIKKLHFYFNFGGGLQYQNYRLRIGTAMGLGNVDDEDNGPDMTINKPLCISFDYLF
jgi:hypothetical protein